MEDIPNITSHDLHNISWEKNGPIIFSSETKHTLSKQERLQVKALLYKERPPLEYRRKIWMTCSGALREKLNAPNYYKSLVQLTKKLTSPSESQIELDLRRTFPDDPKALESEFIEQLRNVLICYSIRNSTVGYCQGMNFIVGKFLYVLEDEENAFWLLVQTAEYLLPLYYYCELAGVITESSIMSIMVDKYLPDLYSFLLENQLELVINNFIHKWFVGLYCQCFNLNLSEIILDFFFLEGNVALIKSCIGILAVLSPQIMESADSEDVYGLINDNTSIIKNPQLLLYFLAQRKWEITNNKLIFYISQFQKPILNNLRQDKISNKLQRRNSFFGAVYRKQKIHCDPNWPVCIYDTKFYDIVDYMVLSIKKTPLIIDDYYYIKTTHYPSKNKELIDEINMLNDKDILCERKNHTCDDRKLVENSVALLDENKAKSEDANIMLENYNNDMDIEDIYNEVLQGDEIKNIKAKLIKEFNPGVIKFSEIKKYI